MQHSCLYSRQRKRNNIRDSKKAFKVRKSIHTLTHLYEEKCGSVWESLHSIACCLWRQKRWRHRWPTTLVGCRDWTASVLWAGKFTFWPKALKWMTSWDLHPYWVWFVGLKKDLFRLHWIGRRSFSFRKANWMHFVCVFIWWINLKIVHECKFCSSFIDYGIEKLFFCECLLLSYFKPNIAK